MNSDAVNKSTVVSAIGMIENAAKVIVSDTEPSTARRPTAAGRLLITRISRLPNTKIMTRNGIVAIRLR